MSGEVKGDGSKTPPARAPRIPMREQAAGERGHNFREVPYGYSEEEARDEAGRCLQCKKFPVSRAAR